METVELVKQIKGYDTITVSIFTPYRGTVLQKVAVKNGWLDKDHITIHTTSSSVLKMPKPYLSSKDIDGLMKTIPLYVYFPKSEWKNIRKAEESDDEGLSLQELVNRIRKEYASKDVVSNEIFKTSLLEANFNDNDQYNNRLWNLESRKGYYVNGEFPKLTRKNVNNLITSAIYKIDLESCSEFNSKLTEIHNKLSGDPNAND